MKISEDKDFRQQILEAIKSREFKERIGVHQSDLVFCLNKTTLRKLKPLPITDEKTLLFSIGWSTQYLLTGKQEDEPEKEVDGIIVTLDAWDEQREAAWECKATYQSSNKAIEENIHWLRQLMCQCYVTRTTVAYLSRFQIMGDYKWIFGKKEEKTTAKRPTLSAWRVEFEQEELDRFWSWMKERKVLYEEILRTNVLLPKVVALASGMAWECGFCEYKEECDVRDKG